MNEQNKGTGLAAEFVLTVYKKSIKQLTAERDQLQLKVVEQAAWIEKIKNCYSQVSGEMYRDVARADVAAIWKAIPTDSKQILTEWLDEHLGEPVTTIMLLDDAGRQINMTLQTPLFKKPEVLK